MERQPDPEELTGEEPKAQVGAQDETGQADQMAEDLAAANSTRPDSSETVWGPSFKRSKPERPSNAGWQP